MRTTLQSTGLALATALLFGAATRGDVAVGTFDSYDPVAGTIVLMQKKGKQPEKLEFTVTPQTPVFLANKKSKIDLAKPKDAFTVTYRKVGDKVVVDKISAKRPLPVKTMDPNDPAARKDAEPKLGAPNSRDREAAFRDLYNKKFGKFDGKLQAPSPAQ
ncbi:MAG: hypothetical protein ACRC1K_13985 [Planctomycetia bacterium]